MVDAAELAGFRLPLLAPGTPRAATLIDAQTGFTAERTLVIDGRTYQGKVWAMPGRERHEQAIAGLHPVFLLRGDRPLGEVVLQSLKTVVEFEVPAELRLLNVAALKTHPVGSEAVNGIATTKYAIDKSIPEGHAEGTLWLSRGWHPDAARRQLHQCERQSLDGSLGAQRGQEWTASGGAVRAARRLLEAAPRGDRPAARAEAEGGRAALIGSYYPARGPRSALH